MAEETGASAPYTPSSSKGNIVYLGIDLGTANSSIATSTNIKRTVPSVVGWPKDLISYKFIQKPIVFGEESIRNRMALDLIYPLEKGVLKYKPTNGRGETNERDAIAGDELIRHVVALAEVKENQTVRAIIGAPALASLSDKQAIIDSVQGLVDAVMVVSEPFLVAYGLGLYNNALVVDIGAGTLDLCRMHGTIPDDIDQRTLYKAGNYIDEKFHTLLQQ